ncbi:MAG: repressor LexA [Rickettsiales bacterium]|nr:repressor LexA [Rickettsiales bacterium]
MLTLKQKKLLDYIDVYFKENSVFPTYEEMKDALNIKSKSSIHKLISSIEERGFIERIPHKARAIQFKDKKTDLNKIPYLGRIAAGNPIEAITSSFEQISVPDYLITNSKEHFALEVIGDSMRDEGIFNGDIVIIKKTNIASTGDIVVALIDENEVTLKKFRSFKNSIALEPANKNFKTRIFGPERVNIQGLLVGLIRKFN